MIIKLFEIFGPGKEVKFEINPSSLNSRLCLVSDESAKKISQPLVVFCSPVTADLKLVKSDSSVQVKGNAKADYQTSCSRCMSEVTSKLDVEIDILLKPKGSEDEESGANEFEEGKGFEEDLHTGFYENKQIDLADIVEEFIVLAIPYFILCSDECAGLCPKCGSNMNLQNCSCSLEEDDAANPFSVLKGIKIQ